MPQDNALLTFSIGPVHTFISQARKVADLWAGSQLLSHLTQSAIRVLDGQPDCTLVHPFAKSIADLPRTLTNRFTCRVPSAEAERLAGLMSRAVEETWQSLVTQTAEHLRDAYDLNMAPTIWEPGSPTNQASGVIETSWSWVAESTPAADPAGIGVALSKQSRLYRPFAPIEEVDDKCAVCGERSALPDGHRTRVRNFWKDAAEKTAKGKDQVDQPFLRDVQTRLCLVCATKRFFPKWYPGTQAEASAVRSKRSSKKKASVYSRFYPFESFKASDERQYFALVAMDGDKMGEILEWGEDRVGEGNVEAFRRELSEALTAFANDLQVPLERQSEQRAGLRYDTTDGFQPADPEAQPQLIFAGGEDVRFVCHARDALPLAKQIRRRYRDLLGQVGEKYLKPEDQRRLTISAGILYAHVKHSAGLLYRDVELLLDHKAKRDTGRDAVALRLDKRSGGTVDVAFKWDEIPRASDPILHLAPFEEIVERVRTSNLSSSSSFDLRQDEETLRAVFEDKPDHWSRWLSQALRRDGMGDQDAAALAGLLTPFFIQGRTEALRVARFLGREIQE